MIRTIAGTCAVLLWIALPLIAQQSTKPTRAELQAEIARLRTELTACQGAATASAAAKNDFKREEALASLRAVKSALDTGANLQEFKKYQIESRIKVDALPTTEENAAIHDVSDLYRDAVVFGVARVIGGISGSELAAMKKKYQSGADTELGDSINKYLQKIVPEESISERAHAMTLDYLKGRTVPERAYAEYDAVQREYITNVNKVSAEAIEKLLLTFANDRLSKLK